MASRRSSSRPRRDNAWPGAATAAQAVLLDDDLADVILRDLAVAVGGWCPALFNAGRVCTLWRDSLHALRTDLEEWCTYRWDVDKISQFGQTIANDREARHVLTSPLFTCGAGAYQWRLILSYDPAIIFLNDPDGEFLEAVGLYLEAAAPLAPRASEFELQLLNPTSELVVSSPAGASAQRGQGGDLGHSGVLANWKVPKFVFNEQAGWRHGNPTYLSPPSMYRALGIVGDDDVLRTLVHVRVRNGRAACPSACHALVAAKPTVTYARYGGRWYCDVCGKEGEPNGPMFHCAHGCEYDLCAPCHRAMERVRSLRSNRRAGDPGGAWSPRAKAAAMHVATLPQSGGWAGF